MNFAAAMLSNVGALVYKLFANETKRQLLSESRNG